MRTIAERKHHVFFNYRLLSISQFPKKKITTLEGEKKNKERADSLTQNYQYPTLVHSEKHYPRARIEKEIVNC